MNVPVWVRLPFSVTAPLMYGPTHAGRDRSPHRKRLAPAVDVMNASVPERSVAPATEEVETGNVQRAGEDAQVACNGRGGGERLPRSRSCLP